MPGEAVISETEWLLTFGTHPLTIAVQLGMKLESLQRVMERHGRDDLREALRVSKDELL